MATSSQMPKSILKKPQYPADTTRTREDHNREIALYHANLIQQRKDVELEILNSMELLIDYPLSGPPYTAANPSATDAQSFKQHLRPFQPSDYDALIEERNINEHCGYTLCSKPRAKDGQGGKYRLIGMYGKAKDFKVVERWEVEKWCSEECARRALYVRVQLGEGPAWERGGYSVNVELLDEPKEVVDGIAERLEAMELDGGEMEDRMQNSRDLAVERGDRGLAAKNGLVEFAIKENMEQGPVHPPTLDDGDITGVYFLSQIFPSRHLTNSDFPDRLHTMHLNLEGHTTTFGRSNGGNDSDEDTDWKL
jgi:hypothetical protein